MMCMYILHTYGGAIKIAEAVYMVDINRYSVSIIFCHKFYDICPFSIENIFAQMA